MMTNLPSLVKELVALSEGTFCEVVNAAIEERTGDLIVGVEGLTPHTVALFASDGLHRAKRSTIEYFGHCNDCDTDVASWSRDGICPVCNSHVEMSMDVFGSILDGSNEEEGIW